MSFFKEKKEGLLKDKEFEEYYALDIYLKSGSIFRFNKVMQIIKLNKMKYSECEVGPGVIVKCKSSDEREYLKLKLGVYDVD